METIKQLLVQDEAAYPGCGEKKMEAVGDYLSDHGWLQVFLPWIPVDDDAWLKGNTLILVDEVGIFIYRVKDGEWKRIGGVGFLSMPEFPLVSFGNGRYGCNLESGMVAPLPTIMWPEDKTRRTK